MPVSESVSTSDQHGNRLFPVGHLLPFILVTALFFLWGIPNNLNDVLIRQFMKSFTISRTQAGLVQSAFYFGYFVLAMPAAIMMRKIGVQGGICRRSLFIRAGQSFFWLVRNRKWTFVSGNSLKSILAVQLRLGLGLATRDADYLILFPGNEGFHSDRGSVSVTRRLVMK
jgi:fucose permease